MVRFPLIYSQLATHWPMMKYAPEFTWTENKNEAMSDEQPRRQASLFIFLINTNLHKTCYHKIRFGIFINYFINFFLLLLACQVLVCNFHSEQAWEQWLNATENGTGMIKDVMWCKFGWIERARIEEALKNHLNDLRNCHYWKGG